MQHWNGILGRSARCQAMHVFGRLHRIDLGWYHPYDALRCLGIVPRCIFIGCVSNELRPFMRRGGIGRGGNGRPRGFIQRHLGRNQGRKCPLCSLGRGEFFLGGGQRNFFLGGLAAAQVRMFGVYLLVRVCSTGHNGVVGDFAGSIDCGREDIPCDYSSSLYSIAARRCVVAIASSPGSSSRFLFQVGISQMSRILRNMNFGEAPSITKACR